MTYAAARSDEYISEMLKALAGQLAAATELPGAGTGELTGRQAVAATRLGWPEAEKSAGIHREFQYNPPSYTAEK